MAEIKRIERGRLYTYGNPPPSREAAISRLETLEVAVAEVVAQLEKPDFNGFATNYHFEYWKVRATNALAHMRAEINYLQRWINHQDQLDREKQNQLNREKHEVAIPIPEGIEASIWNIVEIMRKKFHPVYTEGRLPLDLAETYNRKYELYVIGKEFMKIFEDLKVQGKTAEVGRQKMINAQRPLSDLYQELIAERKLLNDFLSEKRGNWKPLVLSIIDRAIASGFVISDEEKTFLHDLRMETV